MKKGLSILVALLLVCLMMLAGCGGTTNDQPATDDTQANAENQEPVELLVSVAASMTDAMEEIKTLYTADHSNVTITYNFGSSGALQQQIEQGAPANVFLSAGKKQMTALVDAGLMVEGSVKDLVQNQVVLVVPKDEAAITFADLATDKVAKIAIGDPQSVPAGQYASEVFEKMGLTDAVSGKLILAKDVREVLSWVETGNVEAGIVYATDAQISDKVTVSDTAAEDTHSPIVYPMGIVKTDSNQDAAQAFVDFLSTQAAKDVFAKYGFTPIS